jgi:alanyl-tRNA synthetase
MEETKTSGNVLHSAEHIFSRSLQNLGTKLIITKADTFREDGRAFLLIQGKIPIEKLFDAEHNVNFLIPKCLKVSIETFENLTKARTKYSNLRFNEERLKEKKNIRVVKIGNFDACACKNKHVTNTSEIGAFVIVDVSYLGGNTQLEFKASYDAINYLTSINEQVLMLSQSNNFKTKGLFSNYKLLKANVEQENLELDKLFFQLLSNYRSKFLDLGEMSFSRFYKIISNFIKENPERCILILSKSQILAIKGTDNKSDIKLIGNVLKERKAFIGDVREDYINGKILDYTKANVVLAETSNLIE